MENEDFFFKLGSTSGQCMSISMINPLTSLIQEVTQDLPHMSTSPKRLQSNITKNQPVKILSTMGLEYVQIVST